MMFKLFLPGVLMLTLLSSCDPADKYATEIEQIDSCLLVLDDIEERFNGIEFDSLAYMVTHVLNNEDSVKKYYTPDTLSMDIGIRMNDCKGIRKSMKGVKVKQEEFSMEISQLRLQFENLKEDIANGVLKDEQVKDYLVTETKDLEVLNLSFTAFYELQELQSQYYYASSPIIDEFIADLKNEANQE